MAGRVMLCKQPFTKDGVAFGCGQCGPCRYNKRRVWVHRIMLEAAQFEDNAFVTLTYDDEHLPVDGSLRPVDYQLWLKRLRERFGQKFRYFLVGEYGDVSFRPHYHAALFGFPTCRYGKTNFSQRSGRCCVACDLVRETWSHGNVMLGRLEDDSAGYISGYVVKKMTGRDDPRLQGLHPEFARMSLKPGIGFNALWEIADSLFKYELDRNLPDVPAALRHGSKELPLGRYLRRKLRMISGKEENAPESTMEELRETLRPLRVAAFNGSRSFAKEIAAAGKGARAAQSARSRIYKQRREL